MIANAGVAAVASTIFVRIALGSWAVGLRTGFRFHQSEAVLW